MLVNLTWIRSLIFCACIFTSDVSLLTTERVMIMNTENITAMRMRLRTRQGEKKVIRRISVRESTIFGSKLRDPWNPSIQYNAVMVQGVSGEPSVRHPWWRETLVSSVVFRVWRIPGQAGKTTQTGRPVVQETGISRHHWGPIEGLPEIPQTITTLWYWRVQRGVSI